jgi:mono/diheme cytochrome c family protein
VTARPRLACLAAVVLLAACGATRERERRDFERMRVQQRLDLYGASAVLPGGTSMQPPPPGVVSRETAAQQARFAIDSVSAGAVTTIPLSVTPQLLARGKNRFAIYCAACHGAGGYGGSIVAENMDPPRPPSFHSARIRALPVGYLYYVATHGIGRMPSYAAQLAPQDRWAVIAYIRDLQSRGAATEAERADSSNAARIGNLGTVGAAGAPR